jgi:hypothetical protein
VLLFYRNFCTRKNIKEHISDQIMPVFEARELPTMRDAFGSAENDCHFFFFTFSFLPS